MKNKAQGDVVRSGIKHSSDSYKNARPSKNRLPVEDGCSRTSLGTSVKSKLQWTVQNVLGPFQLKSLQKKKKKKKSDLE